MEAYESIDYSLLQSGVVNLRYCLSVTNTSNKCFIVYVSKLIAEQIDLYNRMLYYLN